MPPPASHRLDMLVLSHDPLADRSAVADLVAAWTPLAAQSALVAGGHGLVRLEGDGPLRFLANRQGGFRVYCPVSGENVVGAFVVALTAWRAGGPRTLQCPCGTPHDLTTLAYAPPAGFAASWILIPDVASAELTPEAVRIAKEVLGEVRVVLRRG